MPEPFVPRPRGSAIGTRLRSISIRCSTEIKTRQRIVHDTASLTVLIWLVENLSGIALLFKSLEHLLASKPQPSNFHKNKLCACLICACT